MGKTDHLRLASDAAHREAAVPQIVLVVEDDASMLDIISFILEDAGYRVLQARNGDSALSVLQMIRPDMIVSDVMMPEMDGLTFCERVRADLSHIPFIFLTARVEKNNVRQGMKLGADDYLTKPFEPEDLLSAVQIRLARAAEARSQFEQIAADVRKQGVRALSHELRTPLSLVFGYTELLKATGPQMDEDDMQTILHGLYSGTRRMKNLVEDFLLYSRLESGLFAEEIDQMSFQTVQPDQVVRREVERFQGAASDQDVTLTLRLGASGETLAIYEASLAEIVRRLVDNAIKFSKKGGGQALVSTHVDGGSWVLQVADDGIGIRRDALPHIFEAFRQVDRDKREQQGAGLGLAIVRGLVEAFGGRITVESLLGRGCRFNVYLPLAPSGSRHVTS
jgi:two-component system, sensor histidine kinase and response regulator